MTALLELAERCEAATGPDRELDELIAAELAGAVREVQHGVSHYHRDGRWVSVGEIKPYTASLDAAMTLVPEWCVWSTGDWKANGHCASASVWPPEDKRPEGFHGIAQAATPALALCVAALRARAIA